MLNYILRHFSRLYIAHMNELVIQFSYFTHTFKNQEYIYIFYNILIRQRLDENSYIFLGVDSFVIYYNICLHNSRMIKLMYENHILSHQNLIAMCFEILDRHLVLTFWFFYFSITLAHTKPTTCKIFDSFTSVSVIVVLFVFKLIDKVKFMHDFEETFDI